MTAPAPHQPVMLSEVLTALSPRTGEVYVDATFGAGGYSRAIREAADCTLYALDRDPAAVQFSTPLKNAFGSTFHFIHGCFGDMRELLATEGVSAVDGVVLDIGVSSMQLDQPERGFSFRTDGPLDMRMGGEGLSAAEVVNQLGEKELADILYLYGEEKASRRIARAIVSNRPLTRTLELADLVRSVLPKAGKEKKDPATRTFQALRIYVNNELEQLRQALEAAEVLLSPGGRLVVVVFHSLEDRLVKQFIRSRSVQESGSRHFPAVASRVLTLRDPVKIRVSEEEATKNPRARSAVLHTAIKI